MATHEAVQTMLTAFNDYLLERAYGERNMFLFHDEIADIIRSAPNGATVEIWDFPDVRESFTLHRTSRATTFGSCFGRSVSMRDMICTIYNELEAGGYITIDGNDIMTL